MSKMALQIGSIVRQSEKQGLLSLEQLMIADPSQDWSGIWLYSMRSSILQRLIRLSRSKSPWVFLAGVGCSVFIAEVLVMFLFMALPKLPAIVEAFADGTLLSILIAPALYYFLYQPLRLENKERELIEQELRQTTKQLELQAQQLQEYSQALELKVAERTQELSHKNSQLQGLLEELHSTQVQMVQNEKISSLGRLVAGVAHEINNPVNFIHGNLNHLKEYIYSLLSFVELYQAHYPDPVSEIEREAEVIDLDFLQNDLPKLLNSMQTGTERIREIVVSLRNFSRLDEAEFKAVNIHEGIDSTLLILQHRLKATSDHPEIIVLRNYGNLPLVECYPGQLNQVLMNILANAIDALEEFTSRRHEEMQKHSSCIKIRTSVVDSGWVEISISGNGLGIPEEIQNKIFDPFFTTKPIGKGTGMGMSISYQIITEKHGGTIECLSIPGQGTECLVRIPIRQQACRTA